jgi:hypothetical protein
MDLTVRLEYLLRVYSAASHYGEADTALLKEQFSKDLEPLVAQYGQEAVIRAFDKLPGWSDSPRPSLSFH